MRDIGFDKIYKYFEKKGWYLNIASPGGYDAETTDLSILFSNWNPVPEAMQEYLRNYYQLEWDDEGTTCGDCCKYIRTNPTCYGWSPNFIMDEYGYVCRECVEDNPEILFEEYANCGTVQLRAMPTWAVELAEKDGWHRLEREDGDDCDSYESGLHYGQNDDPVKLVSMLEKDYPNHDYMFAIDSTGQFDVHWSVYLKERE